MNPIHRLREGLPTQAHSQQVQGLQPGLTTSAAQIATLSAHHRPRGGHLQGWGLHSPSRGPLCPHTARAAPGIGRGEGRFPSSPASLGEHHGSSLGGTWVVGRGPWDHAGGEVRGDGGMGARRPGGRAPPRPPGASTLIRGHTPALRPLTTF